MNAGRFLLKKVTGLIFAAVFFAACLCVGFAAEAGDSPKNWYDKDGLFHEQHDSYVYGTRENTVTAVTSAKSRTRYWYDEKGIFHKEYTFFTAKGDKDVEHIWYDKDGKQYGKEYGYVIINGQTLYRESVTTYDAKGWRHINIFWIYPDNSRRDKHIWFDGKGERHEEWKK